MKHSAHRYVTSILLKLAGFPDYWCGIAGAASARVDQSVEGGIVEFDDGQIFHRYATANEAYGIDNFSNVFAQRSWRPYHFVCGMSGTGKERLICKAAHVNESIRWLQRKMFSKREHYTVYHLGIFLHLYFDSYAHAGFAGVIDATINCPEITTPSNDIVQELGKIAAHMLPLGHVAAGKLPDMPNAVFTLKNDYVTLRRNNFEDFMVCFDNAFDFLRNMADWRDMGNVHPDAHNHIERVVEILASSDDEENVIEQLKSEYSFDFMNEDSANWRQEAIGDPDANGKHNLKEDFFYSPWFKFHLAAADIRHLLTSYWHENNLL